MVYGIREGKTALVFGAAGSLGSAVSKEFAAEGAEVFLSGRTKSTVDQLAKHISSEGGRAQAEVVDALDDGAVNEYVDRIAKQAGRIDVVFNTVSARAHEYNNGRTAVESTVDPFMVAISTMLKSQYITARAAARHMLKQHSGVVIFLTGGPAKAHFPGTTAIGAACGAIEALTRNMALDFSPSGVRVVCIRSSAMTDS